MRLPALEGFGGGETWFVLARLWWAWRLTLLIALSSAVFAFLLPFCVLVSFEVSLTLVGQERFLPRLHPGYISLGFLG